MASWFVFYVPETGEARVCDPEFSNRHETREGAQAEADWANDFYSLVLKMCAARYEVRYVE